MSPSDVLDPSVESVVLATRVRVWAIPKGTSGRCEWK